MTLASLSLFILFLSPFLFSFSECPHGQNPDHTLRALKQIGPDPKGPTLVCRSHPSTMKLAWERSVFNTSLQDKAFCRGPTGPLGRMLVVAGITGHQNWDGAPGPANTTFAILGF